MKITLPIVALASCFFLGIHAFTLVNSSKDELLRVLVGHSEITRKDKKHELVACLLLEPGQSAAVVPAKPNVFQFKDTGDDPQFEKGFISLSFFRGKLDSKLTKKIDKCDPKKLNYDEIKKEAAESIQLFKRNFGTDEKEAVAVANNMATKVTVHFDGMGYTVAVTPAPVKGKGLPKKEPEQKADVSALEIGEWEEPATVGGGHYRGRSTVIGSGKDIEQAHAKRTETLLRVQQEENERLKAELKKAQEAARATVNVCVPQEVQGKD